MTTATNKPAGNLAELSRCPTALTAALERAVATGNRELEREALQHLAVAGIVVVDRAALAKAIADDEPRATQTVRKAAMRAAGDPALRTIACKVLDALAEGVTSGALPGEGSP